MNRYGRMDVAARAAKAPVLEGLGGPALQLKGVRTLDARMEIEAQAGDLLIPPSLRPAIPSYGSIAVSEIADSEVGGDVRQDPGEQELRAAHREQAEREQVDAERQPPP